MDKKVKIFVVGDKSTIGLRLIEYFKSNGFNNVFGDSSCNIELLGQVSVADFFKKERPNYVFLTHIKSGGILANVRSPAEFIYENLEAQNNIIHSAYVNGVKKLLFLASSCVYPKDSPQPIKEEYLLTAELEETNQPYAIAKIAGIQLCQAYSKQFDADFICVIPATVYGQGDHFDIENAHVLSSLIKKFHKAKINQQKQVVVWGTGKPRREFIYVDDIVKAALFLMDNYNESEVINAGVGKDISIEELAKMIREIVGFRGNILFDPAKPDGVYQKLLDNSKIKNLGWKAETSLEKGIELTYEWYKNNFD